MFENATEKAQDEVQKQETNVKLATVTGLFSDGCPKIQFYGDDTSSEKEYSYLSTYQPKLNDIVLLAKTDSSYIILGKVNYKETPSEGVDVTATIVDYLTTNKYIKKESDGTLYIDSSNYNFLKYLDGTRATIGTVVCQTSFNHTGSSFGVFGANPRGQYSILKLSTSIDTTSLTTLGTSVSAVTTKVNTIIDALKSFGFSS